MNLTHMNLAMITEFLINIAMVLLVLVLVVTTQFLAQLYTNFSLAYLKKCNPGIALNKLTPLHCRIMGYTCEDAKTYLMALEMTVDEQRTANQTYLQKYLRAFIADRFLVVIYFLSLLGLIKYINNGGYPAGYAAMLLVLSIVYLFMDIIENHLLCKLLKKFHNYFAGVHNTDKPGKVTLGKVTLGKAELDKDVLDKNGKPPRCFICDEGTANYDRQFYRLALKASAVTVCKLWSVMLLLILILFSYFLTPLS